MGIRIVVAGWTTVLLLFLASAVLPQTSAHATEFTDPSTGVAIRLPDGWERQGDAETGYTRISLTYSLDERRRIEFSLEATIDSDYSVDEWVTRTRSACEKWFDRVTKGFRVDEGEIAGHRTTRCNISGERAGETARRCVQLVVRGDRILQFTEISYCDAHEALTPGPLEQLWDAVRIEDPWATVSVPTDVGEPWRIEDVPANHRLVVPGHYKVDYRPPEDPGLALRSKFSRRDDMGKVCLRIYVLRFEAEDDQAFGTDPGSYIAEKFVSSRVYFSDHFGKDSGSRVDPVIQRGGPFGGVEHGSTIVFRSLTMQEMEDLREAERRNEQPPDLRETVLRCRATTVSPHVYLIAAWFRPDLAEDPVLRREFEEIAESFVISDRTPHPRPLRVNGKSVPPTTGDSALEGPREVETVYEMSGRKIYRLGLRYVVPPGFRQCEAKGTTSIDIYAQDEDHNWMHIIVWHANHLQSSDRDKELVDWRVTCSNWREYWLGRAPDARIPSKPQRVNLSRQLRGRGYKRLTGNVGGWPGSLTVMTFDKSNWRTHVAVETRGKGDRIFASGLRTFLKSLRLDYDAD